MKNKILGAVAGVSLFATLACTLAGCGNTAAVRLASGNVMLGDVAFFNSSNLEICEGETKNTFEVSGDASFFSDEQADAFWMGTATEGDAYIVIELEYANGTTISYTSLTGDKTFTNDEADDVLQIVIALTGEASTGATTRQFTVTTSDETTTTYTLDTTNVNTSKSE